jgi:crotonobetainyl-CoA:carnitine CoA-transferase CaiB-like acyl-CoA transferase
VWQREETNEGCQVDVAIQEALAMHLHLDLAWTTFAGTEISRAVGAQPAIQWVGQQPTSDGYIDFVIRTDEQWRAFVEVLGNPAWSENELFATTPSRARYWDGLEPLIQEELRGWKKDELFRAAQAKGVPAAPVHTVADAAQAGHFADRGAFVEQKHPVLGHVRMPGPPVRFGVEAWALRSAAPSAGQHNREVFVERLGLSEDELARLHNEGVV